MIQFRSIAAASLFLFSSLAKCHGLGGKEISVLVEVREHRGQQTANRTVLDLTVVADCRNDSFSILE
jgi:hypothetical protein